MTNTDTEQPQAYAKHGKILIAVGHASRDGDLDPEEYTPIAAFELATEIMAAAIEAATQLDAIAEACAQGHAWDSGYNRTLSEQKITIHYCERPGCEADKEEPGWLPFEPKEHSAPDYTTMRMVAAECTGPGCEHCSNEAMAKAMNDMFDNINIKLHEDLWAGTTKSQPPADATPEQLQAAPDAREAGNRKWSPTLPVAENPGIPAGYAVIGDWTNYALGTCPGCFCLDSSHNQSGCNADTCPCTTGTEATP